MFILKKEASYYWPVKITQPTGNGATEKSTFDIHFKRISQSRLKEAINSPEANDVDFAKEVVIGWRGVHDEEKKEIQFSESAFADVLEIPGVAAAISTAYLESISGAKAKN